MGWNRTDGLAKMVNAIRMARLAGVGMLAALIGLAGCEKSQDNRPTSMRGQAPSTSEEPVEQIPLTPGPDVTGNGAAGMPGAGGTDATTTGSDGGSGEAAGTNAPATVPEVTLLQRDLAGCPVKVGDVLPDVSLPIVTADGESGAAAGSLHSQYGTKTTVVLLWTPDDAWSVQGLQLLDSSVRTAFAAAIESKELSLIGIAGATTSQAAEGVVTTDAIRSPVLLDADGVWCAKIADKPYRLFLLDATGKIAWFDLECSESTLRDLTTGIRALLQKP